MMIEVHGFTQSGMIDATIDDVRMVVPDDMENAERQLIAVWEEAGNQIPPFETPAAPLPDLAPYQFRAMLKLSGKQEDLYAFVEALPEPQKTIAQSKLEYSLVFKRDNDLVLGAQSALGLTTAELDALWLQASSIL